MWLHPATLAPQRSGVALWMPVALHLQLGINGSSTGRSAEVSECGQRTKAAQCGGSRNNGCGVAGSSVVQSSFVHCWVNVTCNFSDQQCFIRPGWQVRCPAAAAGAPPPRQMWGAPPAAAPSSPCRHGNACVVGIGRGIVQQRGEHECASGCHATTAAAFAAAALHPHGSAGAAAPGAAAAALASSPHQLHIRIQACPASGVGAGQRLAQWHLWPPALPDRGANLRRSAASVAVQHTTPACAGQYPRRCSSRPPSCKRICKAHIHAGPPAQRAAQRPTLKGDIWAKFQGRRQVSTSYSTCAGQTRRTFRRCTGAATRVHAPNAGNAFTEPCLSSVRTAIATACHALLAHHAKAVHIAGRRCAATLQNLWGLRGAAHARASLIEPRGMRQHARVQAKRHSSSSRQSSSCRSARRRRFALGALEAFHRPVRPAVAAHTLPAHSSTHQPDGVGGRCAGQAGIRARALQQLGQVEVWVQAAHERGRCWLGSSGIQPLQSKCVELPHIASQASHSQTRHRRAGNQLGRRVGWWAVHDLRLG